MPPSNINSTLTSSSDQPSNFSSGLIRTVTAAGSGGIVGPETSNTQFYPIAGISLNTNVNIDPGYTYTNPFTTTGNITSDGYIPYNHPYGLQTTPAWNVPSIQSLPSLGQYIAVSPEPILYNIHLVKYQLVPGGPVLKLTFINPADVAPELAIMIAADKQGLKYICILALHDIGQVSHTLTSDQKIQEIEL